MLPLSEIEVTQLRRLMNGENICSSDRPTDRARTRLKRLGYVQFDRSAWLWRITAAGREHLAALDSRLACEYCGPGKRTGLPGNACENCMNAGLKNPTAEDLK
jgi:hypothetical protein